jgi:hypothetical protein
MPTMSNSYGYRLPRVCGDWRLWIPQVARPTPSPAKPTPESETQQEQATSPLSPIRAVTVTPDDVG